MRKLVRFVSLWAKRLKIIVRLLRLRSASKGSRTIVIDIKRPAYFERHLIMFAITLTMTGFDVVFKLRFHFASQVGKYYWILAQNDRVSVAITTPKRYHTYISNNAASSSQLLIKPDQFGLETQDDNALRMPYTMHPIAFSSEHLNRVCDLSSNDTPYRRFRIVFAGNLSASDYQDIHWGESRFINRAETIAQIIQHFASQVVVPRTYEEYLQLTNASICLIDRKYFSLSFSDLLEFYRAGHFALCPPGIRVPLCHNLVESMYCGCVPVLPYGSLLEPRLNHMRECIAYSTTESLINAVETALTMSLDQITALRHNVRYYYGSNMHPPNAAARFHKFVNESGRTICIGWG